jgi:large-conductance mechanosensitive channel
MIPLSVVPCLIIASAALFVLEVAAEKRALGYGKFIAVVRATVMVSAVLLLIVATLQRLP